MEISKDKIETAKLLNRKYNDFCIEREEHEKKWKEILSQCEKEGISIDLVQVTPKVFDFIVERNVAKQYFK